ncbi:MAG: hypothetical protein JSR61_17980 [Proteobacteria bacterium]|nr:hypothetical protein [Pseudomonadota bacterium]
MTQQAPIAAMTKSVPISNADEAASAIGRLNAIMDRLETTLVEETAHVRGGRLRDAVALDAEKLELSRAYTAESERVRAAKAICLATLPEALARLQARHDTFRNLLQTNLTVLATAHAVSEGIVRGVSGELARKQTPSTYGANGRTTPPSVKASQPLAVSRAL